MQLSQLLDGRTRSPRRLQLIRLGLIPGNADPRSLDSNRLTSWARCGRPELTPLHRNYVQQGSPNSARKFKRWFAVDDDPGAVAVACRLEPVTGALMIEAVQPPRDYIGIAAWIVAREPRLT